MLTTYGSCRLRPPASVFTVTAIAGDVPNIERNFYAQFRTRAGVNLPNSKVTLTSSGVGLIVRLGEIDLLEEVFWVVISYETTGNQTDAKVVAQVKTRNDDQTTRRSSSILIDLTTESHFETNRTVTNEADLSSLSGGIIDGAIARSTDSGSYYFYDSESNVDSDGNLISYGAISLGVGKWVKLPFGFTDSFYTDSTTSSIGCDRPVSAVRDALKIPPKTLNQDSVAIRYWFSNGLSNDGGSPVEGLRYTLEVLVNSVRGYDNLFADKFKYYLRGYLNRETLVLNNNLPTVGQPQIWNPSESLIELPTQLLRNHAAVVDIALSFDNDSLFGLVPSNPQIALNIVRLLNIESKVSDVARLLGDIVFSTSDRLLIVPGLKRLKGKASTAVGFIIDDINPKTVFGLFEDLPRQRVVLKGSLNGFPTVLPFPFDSLEFGDVVRAIVSTLPGVSSPVSGTTNLSLNGNSLLVTLTHPINSEGAGIIRSDYPDPLIAGNDQAQFTVTKALVYLNVDGTFYQSSELIVEPNQTQQFTFTSLADFTSIASLPVQSDPGFSLFSPVSVVGASGGSGSITGSVNVYVAYLYSQFNFSATKIEHFGDGVIPTLSTNLSESFINALLKSNNLSDVENVATARDNLDVYSKSFSDGLVLDITVNSASISANTTAIDNNTSSITTNTNAIADLNNNLASESAPGIVELATDGEVAPGLAVQANDSRLVFLDEDDLVSNSDTQAATQQSVKAYVDNSTLGLSAVSSNALTIDGSGIYYADNKFSTPTSTSVVIDTQVEFDTSGANRNFYVAFLRSDATIGTANPAELVTQWNGTTYVDVGNPSPVIPSGTYVFITYVPSGSIRLHLITSLLDEDDFVSNTDLQAPTQQSVKAYVDNLTLELSNVQSNALSLDSEGKLYYADNGFSTLGSASIVLDTEAEFDTSASNRNVAINFIRSDAVFSTVDSNIQIERWNGTTYENVGNPAPPLPKGSFVFSTYILGGTVRQQIIYPPIDEDNFVSNSNQYAPTQQSVKTYVDTSNPAFLSSGTLRTVRFINQDTNISAQTGFGFYSMQVTLDSSTNFFVPPVSHNGARWIVENISGVGGTNEIFVQRWHNLGINPDTGVTALEGIFWQTADPNGNPDVDTWFKYAPVIDEDDLVSNSEIRVPTQQSVKTYVDNRFKFIDISTALTFDANASNTESIAIGASSVASGFNSLALGRDSNAGNTSSVAIGYLSSASSINTVAVGQGSNAASSDTIAIGYLANGTGFKSISIGTEATNNASSTVSIGRSASATDVRAIAIGNSASASVSDAVAIGNNAGGSGGNSVAIGNSASATVANSVQLGVGTNNNELTLQYRSVRLANSRVVTPLTLQPEAGGTVNAVVGGISFVNTSVIVGTVNPPSSPEPLDTFAVSDSRGNASVNNITVDFAGASVNFHGSSSNHIIASSRDCVQFLYVNSAIGWIKK